MIPLLRNILFALLFDEKAAKRQLRGAIGVLAASGAAYADQVAALFGGAPHLAQTIRALAVVCAFGVAAHGDSTKKRSVPEVKA